MHLTSLSWMDLSYKQKYNKLRARSEWFQVFPVWMDILSRLWHGDATTSWVPSSNCLFSIISSLAGLSDATSDVFMSRQEGMSSYFITTWRLGLCSLSVSGIAPLSDPAGAPVLLLWELGVALFGFIVQKDKRKPQCGWNTCAVQVSHRDWRTEIEQDTIVVRSHNQCVRL